MILTRETRGSPAARGKFMSILGGAARHFSIHFPHAQRDAPGGYPMNQRFKSIVITGASSGIGEALALDYAAPGIALALIRRRT